AHSVEDISAQGTAHLLEAQFMQRMMPEKEGRNPRLGIIPLFEEPGTMMNIDSIMRRAYDNPAYRAHMDEIAARRQQPLTQQVQIAHSDNARRSGLLAARAYIHEAHKKMRILNEEKGIRTQFFEGGSISDAYRNGVRAVSASVNAFDLHDFAKFTFQGGDLVNYFSAPSSSIRLFTRNITHMASRFEMQDGQWHVRKRSPMKADDDPSEYQNKRRPNPVMEDIAVAALKDTLADYQREDFRQDTMGTILAVLDYEGEKNAGNRGSRNDMRGNGAARKGNDVGCGDSGHALVPVKIEKMRTISFSEAWQHAGIVPSWIGSQHLAKHLLNEVQKKKAELQGKTGLNAAEQQFMDRFSGVTERSERLLSEQVQLLYDKSPTFRDAQDRTVFGLAMTDPETIGWLERRLKKMSEENPSDPMIQSGRGYVSHIRKTYELAAKLAFEALQGKTLGTEQTIKSQMSSILEHMQHDMQNKSQYRDFLLYVKLRGESKYQSRLTDHQRGVLHNAGDTVVHGRFLAADDPAYGRARLGSVELDAQR
ncbi:MAG: phosphoenolpyruvate carboxylase, partial [Alphaproteobacteria bacterium]